MLLSEKDPFPRTALGMTAAMKSSSSLETVVISSAVTAATAFPLPEGADFLSFFGAFPQASHIAVIFL